jgi:mannose-6-phosphate isomerase-like protein (cupin superfamily)
MRLGMYAPRRFDPQQPHSQDELYLVVHGSGTFVHGDERTPFGPGDALFIAAGIPHRFEDFSDDFATWVVFWGPAGGER